MAPNLPRRLLAAVPRRPLPPALPPRLSRPVARPSARRCSTAPDAPPPPPPPFLQRLRAELKTAMRAKDAPRLAVLRAIMAASLNASKTSTPIKTDVQLVALMRKMQKSAHDTMAEARAAGRQDLLDKETEQVRVLDEYLAGSGVQTPGEDELRALVGEAVAASRGAGTAAKALVGDVMKRLAGQLEGKDVDRKQLASLVKQLAGQ